MAKTKEELNSIKDEVEEFNKKFVELTEEELQQITGGGGVELLNMLGSLGLIGAGGSMKCPCEGCESVIARRALKNHLVRSHDFSLEDAMKLINKDFPELAEQQW